LLDCLDPCGSVLQFRKPELFHPNCPGYPSLLGDWDLFVGRFCVLDCTTLFGAARRSASVQVSELVVATGMELADLTTDIIACVHVMNGTISMPSRSA
jgi:hypothetical protein